jgi:3-hydroxyacyl-CoA dehydrogenase
MKPFDYYSKPQTLYPNKSDYITFYVYDRGACIYSESALSNTKSALKEDYPNAVIQEVLDEEGYKAHQLLYTYEKHKLHEEFVNDLFENFNVTNNPKKQKAFDLAWEKGHANGLEEVYNEFYDLVELIQD